MPKFTSGPWRVDSDNDVELGSGGGFALLNSNDPDTPVNARLIAAAPEMYELLQSIVHWLPTTPALIGEPDWPRMRARGEDILNRIGGEDDDPADCD